MPYSTDAESNKRNPRSPTPEMNLADQILYRVASLDSTVQQGFRRIDENMERLRSDFHDSQLATNDRINNLDKEMHEQFAFKRARIDSLVSEGAREKRIIEDRLVALETWKAVAMAKVGVVIGVVTTVAMLLAPSIRHVLGIVN